MFVQRKQIQKVSKTVKQIYTEGIRRRNFLISDALKEGHARHAPIIDLLDQCIELPITTSSCLQWSEENPFPFELFTFLKYLQENFSTTYRVI